MFSAFIVRFSALGDSSLFSRNLVRLSMTYDVICVFLFSTRKIRGIVVSEAVASMTRLELHQMRHGLEMSDSLKILKSRKI